MEVSRGFETGNLRAGQNAMVCRAIPSVLYEDRDGVLWIGTYDGGLGRFKDGKFTRYTMREGLLTTVFFKSSKMPVAISG